MENVKEAFGQVLREERTKKQLTQAKLAEYSDLDADTIGMYERAKREPLIGTFLQISEGLKVEAGYLVQRLQEALQQQK